MSGLSKSRKRSLVSRALLLCASAAVGLSAATTPAAGQSVLQSAPKDARAITVRAIGDGRTDDTAAIQTAIDQARNKGAGGIVFLPSGRYRISKSILLWQAVRLFGVGPTRPVLILGPSTPGFQKGLSAMVVFAGEGSDPAIPPAFPVQSTVPFDPKIADANPDTFFSVVSNVDIEIGAGNAAAVGVRFHPAQHAFLSHMNFHVGSGLAGTYHVGNESEDIHFFGGRYGIMAEKPSPAWQFALIDSSFTGQREAAIREHEAGLTLVNVRFRDTPVAIELDQGYGDWLWGQHLRFENISKAGILISNEASAFTQVGFEDVIAERAPAFARFRDSGKVTAGAGPLYQVRSFTHGMTVPGMGQTGSIETLVDFEPIVKFPPERPPTIRALPPVSEWVDVRGLGAKGDNVTDDTDALRTAIATHRVLYFPQGRYKVSDTLLLRADTVLVGLHPSQTQIILADETPAFAGLGAPKALIETPKGGTNIVAGLGLFTGGINPRATALLWRAGEASLLDDVKLQGGHGTQLADGTRFNPYNDTHSADADPRKRWDGQYPSVWVTDGGGGTFAGIWSPDTYAQAGLYVSNTSTPGHVYDFSNEHHVRNEMVFDGVSNWELFDFQSEEEAGESQDTVSLEIRNSHDLLVANYHGYRVTRSVKPALTAVKLYNSTGIRFRNLNVNAESGYATCDKNGCGSILRASKFPFENAIVDMTSGLQMRERELAVLDVLATAAPPPSTNFQDFTVEKLQDGFYGLTGAAVDRAGRLYFVDRHDQRIYRWTAEKRLEVVRDNPLDPVQLAFDRSDNLLVLSSAGAEGTVYTFRPDTPGTELALIAPTPHIRRPDAITALPVNWWANGEFRDQLDVRTYSYPTLGEMFRTLAGERKAFEYVSPDGSLVLPAFRVFQQGTTDHLGWRWSPALEAYGLVTARAGERLYVTNESEDITYRGEVGPGGALVNLRPFAQRGGEAVAVDADGRVYVANGEIFVYDKEGHELGKIKVPARPIGLVFGGPDHRTLYVLGQHAVYAVHP